MKQGTLVLCLLLSAALTHAQTDDNKKTVAKSETAKTTASNDAALELKERRARARSLLVSLSTDARTFHDQTLRARSLARIADALWTVDAEQGRTLFRKAWEAAEVADQDSDRKLQEEISQQKTRTGGGYAVSLPPNVRREVLQMASRRDRALGEEMLDKLKAQKAEAANNNPQLSGRTSEAISQRMAVAKDLLVNGEADKALQFAAPALTVVTRETIDFLSDLREKNANAADSAYAALLASSANNPQSDANTVSFLSSYIFTPHLFMTFNGTSISSSSSSSKITPAAVSPDLRNAFFRSAAAMLLRPLPAPGEQDQSSAGLDGKYLVIKRLMPLFEKSAPAGIVESLRGQMNALNAMVSDKARGREDEAVSRGVRSERPAADREQSLLERLDRAKTSDERDGIYVQLAMMNANRGDVKAREFIGKVEDSETRKNGEGYIDAALVMHFVQKSKPDEALELVHKGELTHIEKSWALAECAKLLAKSDHQKALDLVEQASDEARRIDVSDPALPRALVAVANALKVVDNTRVWDAAFDAVKAANSAEGFTGEDGELVLKFQSKGQSSVRTNDVAEFDLEGIFKDLALEDYDRAVELARGFQGEGPRAVATIAIAKAILATDKRR